jgi:hypothetical protein
VDAGASEDEAREVDDLAESFDHLIRPREQRRRDREVEGLGGLQIDDQLELGWLIDGEIARFGSFQDPIHKHSSAALRVSKARPIRDEGTCLGTLPIALNGR